MPLGKAFGDFLLYTVVVVVVVVVVFFFFFFFLRGQILSFFTKKIVSFWDLFSVKFNKFCYKNLSSFFFGDILVTKNCGGVNDAKDFLLGKKKWAQIAT